MDTQILLHRGISVPIKADCGAKTTVPALSPGFHYAC
jgi:hypothetical protein